MSAGGSAPQFGERAEFGPDDVCYRHPSEHSFTLCQRCGRTICSKCQVSSAVGVLCPECVREAQPGVAQRATRQAKVATRRIALSDAPVVTYGIMIACAAVFVLQWLTATFGDAQVTRALWYAPLYSFPPGFLPDLGFEPWRMVTAIFTHATNNLLHILFNMYALWLFGRNLEQLLGRAWFLLLYLFAGVGGSLMVMLWVYFDPYTVNVPTVGASGAIFGVMGATLVAYRAARVNVVSLLVLVGINFAIGFMSSGISWQAHLGGLVVGALAMQLLLLTRGPRKQRLRVLIMSALGVALVLLSLLYFVALPF